VCPTGPGDPGQRLWFAVGQEVFVDEVHGVAACVRKIGQLARDIDHIPSTGFSDTRRGELLL
jgi:hypothetical protein